VSESANLLASKLEKVKSGKWAACWNLGGARSVYSGPSRWGAVTPSRTRHHAATPDFATRVRQAPIRVRQAASGTSRWGKNGFGIG